MAFLGFHFCSAGAAVFPCRTHHRHKAAPPHGRQIAAGFATSNKPALPARQSVHSARRAGGTHLFRTATGLPTVSKKAVMASTVVRSARPLHRTYTCRFGASVGASPLASSSAIVVHGVF
eukprot:scaffold4487_cov103-Isochrysis_galbana.AAC.1